MSEPCRHEREADHAWRHVSEAEGERDAALAEVDRLFMVAADALDRECAALATIERVMALHGIADCCDQCHRQSCAVDKMLWPCPTIRALEELS